VGYTFLIGGARSGKSNLAVRYAQRAEASGQPIVFVVTAEALDDEMTERVARHRAERSPAWQVLEAPRDLFGTLRSELTTEPDAQIRPGFLVIDCVSFWVANLVMGDITDEGIEREAAVVARSLALRGERSVVVSNEVGLSLVPENPLGRRFRDVLGRVNAIFARSADEAYFLVAGRALRLEELPLE
jgi:adenosyl cobinamide kinase/adenosyl cobinamide phosphate guanylyltransferase